MRLYRSECADAAEDFWDQYKNEGINFRRNNGGVVSYTFSNGLYLNCVIAREGVEWVSLRAPGIMEGLLEMAREDGISGRMMIYGVGFLFGVLSDEEYEESRQDQRERGRCRDRRY
jgi:hypothetical protein